MRIKHGVSALAMGTWIGLAATTGAHAQAPTAEDKRIAALEAQVRLLMNEVHHLKSDQAATAPTRRHGRYAPEVAAAPEPAEGAPGTPAAPIRTAISSQPNLPSSPAIPAAATSSIIPGASIVGGHPAIASADGRFTANLHGVMQFDAANYFQRDIGPVTSDFRRSGTGDSQHARDLASGTDFRRARIGIDGKVFGDFEYNMLFDFGGSGSEDAGHIQELWAQYSGFAPFHLRVGAFQPSFGLEDQGSTGSMPFLERPATTDVARGLSASDYREAAELWATGPQWFAAGAVTTRNVGVVNTGNTSNTITSTGTIKINGVTYPITTTGTNSAADNGVSVPYNQAVGFVGRAVANPYLSPNTTTLLGVHGSYGMVANTGGPDGESTGVDLRIQPESRVDSTRLIDTGSIQASHVSDISGEAAYQYRSFYVEGEFDHIMVDRRASTLSNPDFNGYYVEGSYFLTGEKRKYNPNTAAFDGPVVTHPFSLKNRTWGAWEVALRYSDLDLNYHPGAEGTAPSADAIRGGNQHIFTAGVNWYLNSVVRMMFDYQHVDVRRLSPSATTYNTPVGAQIGQAYNVLEVRTQLQF